MAASEITKYAAELRGLLAGVGAGATALGNLTAATSNLAALADSAPGTLTETAWQSARDDWETARNGFGKTLAEALLGPLAGVPGLAELPTPGCPRPVPLPPSPFKLIPNSAALQGGPGAAWWQRPADGRFFLLSPRMVRVIEGLASDWHRLDERIEGLSSECTF